MIVHTQADQLLPQLLVEQFVTLPTQCRHIEQLHEGIWFKKMLYPHKLVYCFQIRLPVRPCVRKVLCL